MIYRTFRENMPTYMLSGVVLGAREVLFGVKHKNAEFHDFPTLCGKQYFNGKYDFHQKVTFHRKSPKTPMQTMRKPLLFTLRGKAQNLEQNMIFTGKHDFPRKIPRAAASAGGRGRESLILAKKK